MSQAIAIAIATTCARSAATTGINGGFGITKVEIVDDRQALGQSVPVDLQHRDQPLGIERTIVVGLLLVFPAGRTRRS